MKNYFLPAIAVAFLASVFIYFEKNNEKETHKYYLNTINQNSSNPEAIAETTDELPKIAELEVKTDEVFAPANDVVCNLGADENLYFDDPYDNSVSLTINKDLSQGYNVYLEYDLYGLADFTSVCRSINDYVASGGLVVTSGQGWTHQREMISPNQLKSGSNIIRFSVPEGTNVRYSIKNVRIVTEKSSAKSKSIEVNQEMQRSYFGQYAYISGFVSGFDSKEVTVYANNTQINTYNGIFEGVIMLDEQESSKKSVVVTAVYTDGTSIKKEINLVNNKSYEYLNSNNYKHAYTENFAFPGQKFELNLNSLYLKAEPGCVSQGLNISATGLRSVDMPLPGDAMVNVTAQNSGYRCLPHGTLFESDIEIGIKYDPSLLPNGYGPEDIRTFYFDETTSDWVMLELDSIDVANNLIISKTNHFTDFINAILKSPELPQTEAFTPTKLKNLDYAHPLDGINTISPPTPNNNGTANLSFPLQLPEGRNGMQPNLAITYNSDGGNGVIGVGWDLNIPAITVDTRWGVPRYDEAYETEEYLLNGEQLIQLGVSGEFHDRLGVLHMETSNRDRSTTESVNFAKRIEGDFNKVIRHGTNPSNYWWEVIDKNGTQYLYGKYNDASINDICKLSDTESGNIASWPLTEVRDVFGNTMIYKYVVETSLSYGKQIYISNIFYTGFGNELGKYKIEFTRESRTDAYTNCRFGFVVEVLSRIKGVNIYYNNDPVRKYVLNYKDGAYGKSVLATIADVTDFTQLQNVTGVTDCNTLTQYFGATLHCFDYFMETGLSFQHDGLNSLSLDDASIILTDGFGEFEDPFEISLEKGIGISALAGGTAAVGFGNDYSSKINTVGANVMTNVGIDFDRSQLLDINGDNIIDKVFVDNSAIYFYPGYLDQNKLHHFNETSILIPGLPSLGRTWNLTPAAGMEIQAGALFASAFLSYQYSNTYQINTRYFTDINADGFIDFVNNGKAYFNFPNSNGVPQFNLAETNTIPIYTDDDCYIEMDAGVLTSGEIEFSQSTGRRDPVVMWKAPADVKIDISVLVQRNVSIVSLQSLVEISMQIETVDLNMDDYIFCKTFNPQDYNEYNGIFDFDAIFPDGVKLNKGDRVYFRLHAENPNGYDDIKTEFLIKILEKDGVATDLNAVDADGQELYVYQYSNDMLLNDKSVFTAPYSGTLNLSGIIQSTNPQSSDLTLNAIHRAFQSEDTYVETSLFTVNFLSGSTIYADISSIHPGAISLHERDEIVYKLSSNSNVNWNEIEFNDPKVTYSSYVVNGSAVNEELTFYPNLLLDVYPNAVFFSTPVNLVGGTLYKFSPNLNLPQDFNGLIYLTLKKSHRLIKEVCCTVANGAITGSPTISYKPETNETVYFDYYTKEEDISLSTQSKIDIYVDGDLITTKPAGFFSMFSEENEIFGNLYRFWGQFSYYVNNISACEPINEELLVFDESYVTEDVLDEGFPDATVDEDTEFDVITGAFTLAGIPDLINKPFEIMIVDVKSRVWKDLYSSSFCGISKMGSGSGSFIALNSFLDLCDNIMGDVGEAPDYYSYNPTDGNFPVPNKVSRISNNTVSASAVIGDDWGGNLTGTKSWTDSKSLTDFFDLNGDRYPDIVNKKKIQYTNSKGQLSETVDFDEGIKVFPSVGSGKSSGHAAGVKGTKMSGNFTYGTSNSDIPKISGSFAMGENSGESDITFIYADINGDGLQDRINTETSEVEFNIGYSFVQSSIDISNLSSMSNSISYTESYDIGNPFNKHQFSKSGGLSGSENQSREYKTTIDVNADGLVDILVVSEILPSLFVQFNTGNGFTALTPYPTYEGFFLNKTTTTDLGINESRTGGVKILTNYKAVFSAYADASISIPRKLNDLKDVNGDGYVDYLYIENGVVKVKHGIAKKTNLLKSITTPGFSNYNIDYAQNATSINDPNSRWVMSELQVYDDFDFDGGNTSFYKFTYENPVYQRIEREFLGFETVISKQMNTSDEVYRLNKTIYNVSNHFLKGVIVSNTVYGNSESVKYVETFYTTDFKSIQTGEILTANNIDCTNFYPAISSEEVHFYDGNTTVQLTTRKEYTHGSYGNITNYKNFNNTDNGQTEDDIFADIAYDQTAELINQNITGCVSDIVVYNEVPSVWLRKSKGYYFSNGTIKKKLNTLDGTNWISTEIYYDDYGNVETIIYPEDINLDRLQYVYVYDDYVHTYPVTITDFWGNSSTYTYDYKLGVPLTITDQCGNTITYTYYSNGKLNTVLGPNELSVTPYTIKYDYWTTSNSIVPARWAITRHYDPFNTNNEFLTSTICDGLGRVIQTKNRTIIGTVSTAVVSGKINYDVYGRQVSVSHPTTQTYSSSTFSTYYSFTPTYTSTSTYDVLDRITSQIAFDSEETTFDYGFGTDPFGNTGFLKKVTDANSNEVTTYTDARGLQTALVAPLNTITKYTYSPLGELLTSTDPENYVTTYVYDKLGRLTSRDHPDANTTTYTYDLAGNLLTTQTEKLNATSQVINYVYDDCRLSQIQYPVNPEMNVYYQYGANGSGNQTGRLVKQQDASGVQSFKYGKMGELTENIHNFVVPNGEAYSFKTTWTYDSWNRVRTIKYPDGEIVTYGYNTGGQLYSVTGLKGLAQYNYITQITYDKFGNRTRMQYGNNASFTYSYYPDNNRLKYLKSYQYNGGSQIIQDINYNYDPVGNLINIANSAGYAYGNIGGNYSYTFGYDDLYRLTSSTGQFSAYGLSIPRTYSLNMTYSESGNIETKQLTANRLINGSTSTVTYNNSYTYNSGPHKVSSAGGNMYGWDLNGNMNQMVTLTSMRNMCWDEENRLSAVRDVATLSQLSCYLYDASGERAWKLTGPDSQMYINGKVSYNLVDFDKTLYISPLMVMTETEYTKHYFIEGERICSKIGGGFGLLPVLQRPTVSQVSFINGTAETVKANLQTMLNRTIGCVNYTGQWTIEETLAPAYNVNNLTESSRYFYHSDHLGSASMITNSIGRADQHIQYLPYGELFVSQKNSTFDSRYKFTAKELDNETNYTYFGARYYDSDLSSWLSVDPMASERSWVSPYSYCQNSPVMRVDPTGALDGEPDRWKHNRNTGDVTWEGKEGGASKQTITTVEYDGTETEYVIEGKGFDITNGPDGELYKANENGRYQGGHYIMNPFMPFNNFISPTILTLGKTLTIAPFGSGWTAEWGVALDLTYGLKGSIYFSHGPVLGPDLSVGYKGSLFVPVKGQNLSLYKLGGNSENMNAGAGPIAISWGGDSRGGLFNNWNDYNASYKSYSLEFAPASTPLSISRSKTTTYISPALKIF